MTPAGRNMAVPRASRDPRATMSLVRHLAELRNRMFKALVAVVVAAALAFWWYEHGLGGFIRAPYCHLPGDLRYGGDGRPCGLLVTDVFGGVFIRLKVSLLVGVVFSAPVWLYQLWAFVAPGLQRSERRWGVAFVVASTALFAGGAALAYVSLSNGLRLLLGLAGSGIVVALTAQDYVGFLLSVLVAFGVSFELPLLAFALNLAGVLSHDVLGRSRRWLFFLTLVFAAFITPTQDPFTMCLMAVPMIVLFEGVIQASRVVDRRRARRAAVENIHHLSDDEPSPLEADGPGREALSGGRDRRAPS